MENTKTLDVTSARDAMDGKVPDIKIEGAADMFVLLCKASSKEQGWMTCTAAAQIDGVGCIVQVSTQQGSNVAEAITFVPGVRIVTDVNGGARLAKI